MEDQVPNSGLYDGSDPADDPVASPRLHQHRRQETKTSFLAGFRDCHQEVLRYLVSIEQVPLEGQVIFGLEKHLMDLETFMQTAIGSPKVCQTAGVSDGERQGEVSAKNDSSIDESSFDSGCDSSLVGSAGADLSADVVARSEEDPDDERPQTADDTIRDSDMAENARELMHLADSDPRINRILNELFVLMDDDYDDDDDDDDDEDDGIEMEEAADGINLQSQDD